MQRLLEVSTVASADSDNTAPTVVKCTPENGRINVDPAVVELRVTFDELMTADSWSWAYENKEDFPDITGSLYLSGRPDDSGTPGQTGAKQSIRNLDQH